MDQPGQPPDRRLEPRATKLSNHSAEFKITGFPVFQLKVRDPSANGAGIIARTDSKILNIIGIGQELDVKFISSGGTEGLSDHYRSRIEHISEVKEGPYHGHMVVGISILNEIG